VRRAELAAESLRRVVEPDDGCLAAVDVEAAASYLGLTVLSWRPDENKIKGALIRSARTVFVNAALSPPRKRFTTAHALGHYVLGHGGDHYCPAAEDESREREANRFAAALLMPASRVTALWLKLDGVRPAARVRAVAERLLVSREALGYRLLTLGLTRRAPRDAPPRVSRIAI